jgi:hypothetical protein
MRPLAQSAHHHHLVASNHAVINRIREATTGVRDDQLHQKPPDGGWSIAEVLEHLIVSADSYLGPMRSVVDEHRERKAAPDATWKPTFMGGMLAQSLRNPRKLPSPRSYKVGLSPRPRVLEEFLHRQEEVGRRLSDAAGLDWRRIKIRSPVVPILSMNLGDALTVLVVHAERHAMQIERVKREIGG